MSCVQRKLPKDHSVELHKLLLVRHGSENCFILEVNTAYMLRQTRNEGFYLVLVIFLKKKSPSLKCTFLLAFGITRAKYATVIGTAILYLFVYTPVQYEWESRANSVYMCM